MASGLVGPKKPTGRFGKNFVHAEGKRLQFRVEAFNAANTAEFGLLNSNLNNAQFGVIASQANAPRQVQMGLKFIW